MKAKKENKVYRISEENKKRYLDEGYDIYDDEGTVVEYSPKKTISYNDYMKACEEIKRLLAEIARLETEKKTIEKKIIEKKTIEKKMSE